MIVIFIDTVAQVVALEKGPQPLYRIQLGAVRRQVQQREILRHLQSFRQMPTGLIENENHLHLRSDPLADESQMMVHVRGVDRRGQQGRGVPRDRIDRSEQIHPVVLGLLDRRRS